jgi:urate oxidase
MSSVTLKAACYGKDKVRVLKVYREGAKQTAVELTCRLTLEGDIETSFTKADNSVVVTTGMYTHRYIFFESVKSKILTLSTFRYLQKHHLYYGQTQCQRR